MSEPLSITLEDRADLYAALALVDEVQEQLLDWREKDWAEDGGISTDPVNVDGMYRMARDLVQRFQTIRRRHKKRLEARERRGSPLEG